MNQQKSIEIVLTFYFINICHKRHFPILFRMFLFNTENIFN